MLGKHWSEGLVMAGKASWAALPKDMQRFAFPGDALKKAWSKLHTGDQEPYPDKKRAAALIAAAGKQAPKGLDADALAAALQAAWRSFHEGDFKAAYDAGVALGPVGASVAVKAIGIHATHLVDDEAEKLKRVNDFFNRQIRFEDDSVIWQQTDYWATPL